MEYTSKTQRIWLHIAFWLGYTLLYAVISTAFAQPSDLAVPMPLRFFRFWAYEVAMLPMKLVAVYGLLYYIIPKYLIPRKYGLAAVIVALTLGPLLLLYRLQLYYVMYPLLYSEYPSFAPIEARRLLYSFLEFVPAMAGAATIKLLRHHLNSQQREQKLMQEKLQSELNFLRAQTNPHFLFNTLNNIYALARRKASNTPEVIMRLSKILRFTLYECNRVAIPVEDELRIIRDFIALEKLRYSDRLSVSFEETLDNSTYMIAPLLMLPLVENAFKHGISESRFDSEVNIMVSLCKDNFTFQISNDHDESLPGTEDGIGIRNVRRQLELIYPNSHHLELSVDHNVFKVTLAIQLIHKK